MTERKGEGGDEPSTVLRPRRGGAAEGASAATYAITVVAGDGAGTRVLVDGSGAGRVLVGQSPACELRLTDREVSRRHVAFDLQGTRLRVTDLGSTNGTWIRGLSVVDGWVDGAEDVRVGATTLRVERTASDGPVAPTDALRFGRTLGGSAEMRRLYPLCEKLAESAVPVVIEGETGTGKELMAESLHDEGPRASRPFVVFDCSAVPAHLAESEIFGVEAGHGPQPRAGIFEQAHGGTLLLDEIAELDAAIQPKLLRVLERLEVRRMGAGKATPIDVRVLSATRKNLDKEVAAGRFREDLYFRFAVARIELPPLRRREGDVGLLARHFWRQLDTRQPPAPCVLPPWFDDYEWPGNVRELRNAVARLLALGDMEGGEPRAPSPSLPSAPKVGATAATESVAPPRAPSTSWADEILALDLPLPRARQRLAEEFEKRYMERILARYGGNVARAAAASGLARRYFQLLRSKHQPGAK